MTWGTAMVSDICRQPGDGSGFRAYVITHAKPAENT